MSAEQFRLQGIKKAGIIERLAIKMVELSSLQYMAKKYSEKAYDELSWAISDIQGAIEALEITS